MVIRSSDPRSNRVAPNSVSGRFDSCVLARDLAWSAIHGISYFAVTVGPFPEVKTPIFHTIDENGACSCQVYSGVPTPTKTPSNCFGNLGHSFAPCISVE